MPVSTSSCIFFTLPIWSTFMGCVILKEGVTKYDVIQLAVSFLGVLLINFPRGDDTDQSGGIDKSHHHAKSQEYTPGDIMVGSIFALCGAIFGSLAGVCMRTMNKGIHYAISPFWFASGNAMFSPLAFVFQHNYSEAYIGKKSVVYEFPVIFLISLCALCMVFGQILTSRALQLERLAIVSATTYLELAVAFIWDLLIFKTALKWSDLLGCTLIVGVFITITLLKSFGIIEGKKWKLLIWEKN